MNISIATGTTPTQVVEWSPERKAYILQNNTAVDIYLGDSDVTADDAETGGYKLAAGKEIAVSNGGGSDPAALSLFGVHASGSAVKITVLIF